MPWEHAAGREDGQILPGLVMLLIAILVLGVIGLQIGKAAILRSQAQTAADAAALAGATEIKRQLQAQYAAFGTTDISAVDEGLVRSRMADYAARNDARLDPAHAPDDRRRRRPRLGRHRGPARARRGADRPRGHRRRGAGARDAHARPPRPASRAAAPRPSAPAGRAARTSPPRSGTRWASGSASRRSAARATSSRSACSSRPTGSWSGRTTTRSSAATPATPTTPRAGT